MDLSPTVIPKSDQVNADDLIAGPITVTIADVKQGSDEQPVNIVLEEFPGRVYRPSKGMRRVLIEAWGKESKVYKGRRMTLYRDPDVKWAGEKIGGIRISAMSDIAGKLEIPVTTSRNQRVIVTIQPLKASPVRPGSAAVTPEDIAACESIPQLREWWKQIPQARAVIDARVKQLETAALEGDDT